MAGPGSALPRIPYARFEAALRAGNLAFIQRHREQFTLSLLDEAEVRRLIAEQELDGLEESRTTHGAGA